MDPVCVPACVQDAVRYVDELPAFFAELKPDVVYLNQGLNTDSGNSAKPAVSDVTTRFSP